MSQCYLAGVGLHGETLRAGQPRCVPDDWRSDHRLPPIQAKKKAEIAGAGKNLFNAGVDILRLD
jgi:hypothetical protein